MCISLNCTLAETSGNDADGHKDIEGWKGKEKQMNAWGRVSSEDTWGMLGEEWVRHVKTVVGSREGLETMDGSGGNGEDDDEGGREEWHQPGDRKGRWPAWMVLYSPRKYPRTAWEQVHPDNGRV